MPQTTVDQSVVTPLAAVRQQRIDAQLRLLEFGSLLHRKLELEPLLEAFLVEAQGFISFDGLHFESTDPRVEIALGDSAPRGESFDLKLGERVLGELVLWRHDPYEPRDLREIARLAEVLIYPLENALLHHRALMQSMTDEATGFLRESAILRQLPREVRLARRSDLPLAIACVKVAAMDSVAERFGEVAGQRAWQAVATALHGRLRESDLVYRMDDDTFTMVLGNTDAAGAEALSARVQNEVHRAVGVENVRIVLSVSVGVTELDEPDCAESLLERATRALSIAIERGKNSVHVISVDTPIGEDGSDDPTAA